MRSTCAHTVPTTRSILLTVQKWSKLLSNHRFFSNQYHYICEKRRVFQYKLVLTAHTPRDFNKSEWLHGWWWRLLITKCPQLKNVIRDVLEVKVQQQGNKSGEQQKVLGIHNKQTCFSTCICSWWWTKPPKTFPSKQIFKKTHGEILLIIDHSIESFPH